MPQAKHQYAIGVIVGQAVLIDVVTQSSNPWFLGTYGFVLADAKPFADPIPYQGETRLFPIPCEIVASVSCGLSLEKVALQTPVAPTPAEAQSLRVVRTKARCDAMVISLDEVLIKLFNGLLDIATMSEHEYGMLNTELLRLELAESRRNVRPRKKVSKR